MPAITDPQSFQGLVQTQLISQSNPEEIIKSLARKILSAYSEDELLSFAHLTAEREDWKVKQFTAGDLYDGEIFLYLEETVERMLEYASPDFSLQALEDFISKLDSSIQEKLRQEVTLKYCLKHVSEDRAGFPSEKMAVLNSGFSLNEMPEVFFSAN